MFSFTKVKLKKASLWKDRKTCNYFFRLEYLCEDEACIFRLIYPKVESGIPINFNPNIDMTYRTLLDVNPEYTLTFTCDDQHLAFPDKHGNIFYKEIISEKIHEMTIEEIEKKLGYKIKLVECIEEEEENNNES